MTPADLVRMNVLSKAAIYFWLDDTAKPDKVRADSVSKVCKALRINREWLLTGRGGMDAASEPQNQSQPERLDVERLATAIGTVEATIKQAKLSPSPLNKAAAIANLYSNLGESGGNVAATVSTILELLGEAR